MRDPPLLPLVLVSGPKGPTNLSEGLLTTYNLLSNHPLEGAKLDGRGWGEGRGIRILLSDPPPPHQKNCAQGKNRMQQRGRKSEAEPFWASDPPACPPPPPPRGNKGRRATPQWPGWDGHSMGTGPEVWQGRPHRRLRPVRSGPVPSLQVQPGRQLRVRGRQLRLARRVEGVHHRCLMGAVLDPKHVAHLVQRHDLQLEGVRDGRAALQPPALRGIKMDEILWGGCTGGGLRRVSANERCQLPSGPANRPRFQTNRRQSTAHCTRFSHRNSFLKVSFVCGFSPVLL